VIVGSYSYSVRGVEFCGGIQTFVNVSTHNRDSLEAFLETRTEPIYGISIYAGEFLDLTRGRSYTEVKTFHSFELIRNRVGIEPYGLVSFGNYFTSGFGVNHYQVGLDSQINISRRFSAGIYSGVVIPAYGVRTKTGSASSKGIVGLRFTWRL
jgi:hypothetical protein